MRRWFSVGIFCVAGALLVACGGDDDKVVIGSAGSVGAAGAGGRAGSAGASGTRGTAGSSGVAGTAAGRSAGSAGTSVMGSAGTGSAGRGDAPDAGDAGSEQADTGDAATPPCTGCLELRVPFTAAGQSALFQLVFSAHDLSDTVATFRLRTQTLNDQLFVQTFANESGSNLVGLGSFLLLDAPSFGDTETFIDVPLDVAAISSGGFDNASVISIGVIVASRGSFVGPASAVLLLDSITYSGTGGLPPLDFADGAQGFALNVDAGLQTAEVIPH
jgi:hypothetical protein